MPAPSLLSWLVALSALVPVASWEKIASLGNGTLKVSNINAVKSVTVDNVTMLLTGLSLPHAVVVYTWIDEGNIVERQRIALDDEAMYIDPVVSNGEHYLGVGVRWSGPSKVLKWDGDMWVEFQSLNETNNWFMHFLHFDGSLYRTGSVGKQHKLFRVEDNMSYTHIQTLGNDGRHIHECYQFEVQETGAQFLALQEQSHTPDPEVILFEWNGTQLIETQTIAFYDATITQETGQSVQAFTIASETYLAVKFTKATTDRVKGLHVFKWSAVASKFEDYQTVALGFPAGFVVTVISNRFSLVIKPVGAGSRPTVYFWEDGFFVDTGLQLEAEASWHVHTFMVQGETYIAAEVEEAVGLQKLGVWRASLPQTTTPPETTKQRFIADDSITVAPISILCATLLLHWSLL